MLCNFVRTIKKKLSNFFRLATTIGQSCQLRCGLGRACYPCPTCQWLKAAALTDWPYLPFASWHEQLPEVFEQAFQFQNLRFFFSF
jgi:hypothetical protein